MPIQFSPRGSSQTCTTLLADFADEAEDEDLLDSIAGHASNVVAADIVIIFEYERARGFLPTPAMAGRFTELLGNSSHGESNYMPPLRLSENLGPQYAHVRGELVALYAEDHETNLCEQFLVKEEIQAGAFVPLRRGNELVGIMFINYRRARQFSDYDKTIIGTLASTVAIAIQNRRSLRSRDQNILAMTHDLRSPLAAMKVRAKELHGHVEDVADQLEALDGWCDARYSSLTLESGRSVAFESEQVDIKVEADWVWNLLRSDHTSRQLQLDVSLEPDGDHPIRINRRLLRIVLHCLLANATTVPLNSSSTVTVVQTRDQARRFKV